MKTLALLLLLAGTPEGTALRLNPGSQLVLRVPGLERVAVADPTVADVAVTGDGELLVVGRKQGRTSLTLWVRGTPETRQLEIDDGRLASLAALIKETVNPSLSTEVVNGRLVVDGLLGSMEENARLEAIVGDSPDVALLVRLDPRVMPAVAHAMTEQLRKQGFATVRAVALGGRIVLEGAVESQEELKRAQLIADSLYRDLLLAR